MVTIIGGGFSGMMVAYHLLKSTPHCKVRIVNFKYKPGRGVAFSSWSEKHLLNVVAGKMSALDYEPGHFLNWLIQRGIYSEEERDRASLTYVPRQLYGDYLSCIWQSIEDEHSERIELVTAKVDKIDVLDDTYQLQLSSGERLTSNVVVIATGNETPRDPSLIDPGELAGIYHRDPWDPQCLEDLDIHGDVLLLGNGLTMADTVLALEQRGLTGRIFSVSPNGFEVMPHTAPRPAYNDLARDLLKPYKLGEIFRSFKDHLATLKDRDMSAEILVDSLRPYTQDIWASLTLREKRSFMEHLRHRWGTARHRLPQQVYDKIHDMRIDGRLVVIAGKLVSVRKQKMTVKAEVYDKKTGLCEVEVGKIINCTGPETDPERCNNELLRYLCQTGLAMKGPLGLGVMATRNGRVVNSAGQVSDSLHVIGNLMKGVLWETTAVPELRRCAAEIAKQIVHSLHYQAESNPL